MVACCAKAQFIYKSGHVHGDPSSKPAWVTSPFLLLSCSLPAICHGPVQESHKKPKIYLKISLRSDSGHGILSSRIVWTWQSVRRTDTTSMREQAHLSGLWGRGRAVQWNGSFVHSHSHLQSSKTTAVGNSTGLCTLNQVSTYSPSHPLCSFSRPLSLHRSACPPPSRGKNVLPQASDKACLSLLKQRTLAHFHNGSQTADLGTDHSIFSTQRGEEASLG